MDKIVKSVLKIVYNALIMNVQNAKFNTLQMVLNVKNVWIIVTFVIQQLHVSLAKLDIILINHFLSVKNVMKTVYLVMLIHATNVLKDSILLILIVLNVKIIVYLVLLLNVINV